MTETQVMRLIEEDNITNDLLEAKNIAERKCSKPDTIAIILMLFFIGRILIKILSRMK